MKKIIYTQTFLPYFLVLLAIMGRFMPHPPNATPINAIALFAGAYFSRRLSVILPLAAMFLSDLFIGFYSIPIMLSVYASFMFVGMLGWRLTKHRGVARIGSSALLGSTIFFLITNWAVWAFGSFYEHTVAGLLESYIAGLPFYRTMLLGDAFYVTLIFGAYAAIKGLLPNVLLKRKIRILKQFLSKV